MCKSSIQSSKHLLVEGKYDKLFFEACCDKAGLNNIQVGPPETFGSPKNGKNNAIALLPALITQMELQTVTHLGLVVDADDKEAGGMGFANTWNKITEELGKHGYHIPKRPTEADGGFCFTHKDGLPQVGLWIMPDNLSKGFLEDFIKKALVGKEKNLLERAQKTVEGLPEPKKFKPHHTSKAEVASYMAWQATPGQGPHGAVGGNLLDFKNGLGKQYIDWLHKIFAK